jgi:hypothetical protein
LLVMLNHGVQVTINVTNRTRSSRLIRYISLSHPHFPARFSAEEFEVTNKELHATNEELETNNEELRARSNELQELTTLLKNESSWLAKTFDEQKYIKGDF